MENLYEKIGGQEKVEELVSAFYQRVFADPLLMPFFEETSVEKLKKMQVAFFSVALGGPETNMPKSLYAAHQGRGIKVKHLTRFTEHLMSTLRDSGMDDVDAQKIYARISTYSNEVLGESATDG